jgi:hypothetical protein
MTPLALLPLRGDVFAGNAQTRALVDCAFRASLYIQLLAYASLLRGWPASDIHVESVAHAPTTVRVFPLSRPPGFEALLCVAGTPVVR